MSNENIQHPENKNITVFQNIKAVAFDIDGTLYPAWKLFFRMTFYFFRHAIFYLHYGLVRKQLRKMEVASDFYETQAQLMAARMKKTVPQTREMLSQIAYDGLAPFFEKIKPYENIEETFKLFKESGLKIGILSDFPPDQKGDIWGCLKYVDVSISSEETGALKPSAHPFEVLSKKLDVPPEQILYVGNNLKYDVGGARSAGMKTAYIVSFWKQFSARAKHTADFSFSRYSELQKAVLRS